MFSEKPDVRCRLVRKRTMRSTHAVNVTQEEQHDHSGRSVRTHRELALVTSIRIRGVDTALRQGKNKHRLRKKRDEGREKKPNAALASIYTFALVFTSTLPWFLPGSQTPSFFLISSLSAFLSAFPTPVSGILSINSTRSGNCITEAPVLFKWALSSSCVSLAPGLS